MHPNMQRREGIELGGVIEHACALADTSAMVDEAVNALHGLPYGVERCQIRAALCLECLRRSSISAR